MRKHQNTCPDCGANLDPCERCDCHTSTAERLQIIAEANKRNQQRERDFICNQMKSDCGKPPQVAAGCGELL